MARISYQAFRRKIWEYYQKYKRDLPWRKTRDPYRVLVSEIMLQQTQVSRVLHKYPLFLASFPTIRSLAEAPLNSILNVWQGMGYNRRALYLKRIAQIIIHNSKGTISADPDILEELPGIGKATACSISAFAFNTPAVFIETNIRRVFIHFFFPTQNNISDRQIIPLVEKTLDRNNPREWYFALMDYGTVLAKTATNPNKKSKHYSKQSPFEGSNRQIRGMIVRTLLHRPSLSLQQLVQDLRHQNDDIKNNLHTLMKEGIVKEHSGFYTIE